MERAARNHLAGQAALGCGHAILHVDGGDVEACSRSERDLDLRGATIAAGGTDIAHALDAVDRFLERNRDGLLDSLGIGANVGSINLDHWGRKAGIHGDGKIGYANGARER